MPFVQLNRPIWVSRPRGWSSCSSSSSWSAESRRCSCCTSGYLKSTDGRRPSSQDTSVSRLSLRLTNTTDHSSLGPVSSPRGSRDMNDDDTAADGRRSSSPFWPRQGLPAPSARPDNQAELLGATITMRTVVSFVVLGSIIICKAHFALYIASIERENTDGLSIPFFSLGNSLSLAPGLHARVADPTGSWEFATYPLRRPRSVRTLKKAQSSL